MKTLSNYREIDKTIQEFRDFSGDKRYPSPAHLLHYILMHDSTRRFKDICRYFGHAESDDSLPVRERLELLEKAGLLTLKQKDVYRIPSDHVFAEGVVAVDPKGEGSVMTSSEDHQNTVPLTRPQTRRVIDGDRVLCLLVSGKGGKSVQAHVLGVLNRTVNSVLGEFKIDARGRTVVRPLNERIRKNVLVKRKPKSSVKEGDIVKVALTAIPFSRGGLSGEIVEVIGNRMDPGLQTTMVLDKYGIPSLWPNDVTRETINIESGYQLPKPDEYRKDLRDIPFMTIDGSDARDFDDAVYCSEEEYGRRLIVAIADVSHYVQTGSALDREACQRGTSVYFPDRVVPMLPEALSNGICSLNPDEDRNALVCDMQIDHRNQVSEYGFYQAVIKSQARMTYEAVEAFTDGKSDVINNEQLATSMNSLKSVAMGLESNRMDNGSIAFEFPEAHIDLDEDGQIRSIELKERLRSHKIIEECMLAANRCAAEFIHHRYGNRALYRIHPGPSPEDIAVLRQHLQSFGVLLEGGKQPSPSDFQKLLESVMNTRGLFDAVQMLLLHRMGRAVYVPELSDHFALGFAHYTHFTSPIRRYGDLVVHRLIKALIKIPGYSKTSSSCMDLDETSSQCSMTERRADAAVNDVIAWFKAAYMLHRIGERFPGLVTGVKEFGLFVRLDEIFADGLVHVSKVGQEYYIYDETTQTLHGDCTGEAFRLGDRVVVRVLNVDLSESRISLAICR
ncbi:MAG: ribonuclease R [Gammaproteobacteria bacterium]|nr:ribonuclease R [Gammaproteobacteria bacterium]